MLLYFATFRDTENAFFWALDKGIDPNLADTEGMTPLIIAANHQQERLASIRALIAAGANFDSVSTDGWNPLAVAIRTENTDNAKLLVDAGADLALAKSLVTEKARTVPSEEARTEILAALDSFEKLVENPPDD